MITPTNPLDCWIAGKLGLAATLTRAALADWHLDQLRQTLDWARQRSSFYRQHLARLAERPLTSLADLADLPFTTAAHIAADPLRFVCVSQSDISRVVTLDTSGTTGVPKRLFFTEDDQEITLDFFQHGLGLMAKPGDRVMILLPGDKPGGVGDLLFRAIQRLGALPMPVGLAQDVPAIADRLSQGNVDLIIGIPVQVLAVARYWRDHGRRGAVGKVLLCSDNVPTPIITELATLWGCEVFQDWGMTEMGYGGGVDCASHAGYHLQEGDFLFEIVDPETGRPLPAGQSGEIVITTLTRRGMPLIRYRTGDLSRFIEGDCACGSALRRLDRIETRKTGLIPLAGGEISMAALDDVLFRGLGIADFTASLIQGEQPPTLLVRVSPAGTIASGDMDTLRANVRTALDTLPAICGACTRNSLRVEVEVTADAIPFTRQKRTIRLEQTS
jgi:phenylacetate-coenzyme A ligase PaaK-like adenylate-forming protein